MILTWTDVVANDSEIIRFRREMESLFANELRVQGSMFKVQGATALVEKPRT
jgi:hypothetical protein